VVDIHAHFVPLRQGQAAYNTEVDFKGGSLRVGFVATRGTAVGRNTLFIQAGEISAVTAFFEEGDLPKLEALISQAVAKIQELRQKP